MSDLELTKLCAEAMGLRLLPAYPPFHVLASGADYQGLMVSKEGYLFIESGAYDPLHDDAQCLALVKHFGLTIYCEHQERGLYWEVDTEPPMSGCPHGLDLNRAVVEAVAKTQAAK